MSRATTFPADILGRARGFFGRDTEAKPQAPVKKPAQTYHAVSIAPCGGCCSAARKLEGKRFLSREAPILPLKACDRATCQCRYEHHQDRRKSPRRARDYGVSIAAWDDGPEQRQNGARGRRKTDR
jgi:hypothetical protein